jgi:hypothetical protein
LHQRGQPGGRGGRRDVLAPGLPADVERLVAQAVPLVEEEQPHLAQRRAGYALAAPERVVQGRDQDEVLVEQGQLGDAGHTERHGEEQQVQPPAGQPVQQAGGLFLVDLEVEVRIALVHQAQHGGQQIRRDGRDDAEPQHTGERRPHRLRLLQQRPDLRQHRLGPYGEPLARGREQHLARRTLHKGDAECLLQGGHGARQGGLAHPDRGGGVTEVQVLGDGREGAELGQAGLALSARGHPHSRTPTTFTPIHGH